MSEPGDMLTVHQARRVLIEVAALYAVELAGVRQERDKLLAEVESLEKKVCTYPEGLCVCPHFRGTP